MAEVLEETVSQYVGRLAPSPTGALHLGNVRTFMIAWLRARSQSGKMILRMEDLDHPKDKPGADVQVIEDLKWLGFDWDEEYVQSQRKHLYRAALESLRHPASSQPIVYPCVCSRRDVESAQSAPHAGEQLYYPGTCRDRFATWKDAFDFKTERSKSVLPLPPAAGSAREGTGSTAPASLPCWRFRVPAGTIVGFEDVFAGHYEQDVSRTLGDFPIARDEFGAGYTLACVVDDLLMGVTEVVRGDDLLAATPAQILLARALTVDTSFIPHSSFLIPRYLHVPLVVGQDGKRLAKRHGDTRIASFREQGKTPEEILGFLAASCGLAAKGERVSLADLLPRFDLATVPHAPFMI